jgi:hypothetical protein
MDIVLLAAAAVLAAAIVVTLAATLRFGLYVQRYRLPRLSPARLPEVAVVLSLRGRDASLRHVLDRLASQKYPRYRLYVVVDHPSDPSWSVVQRWQRSHPPVRIQVEFLRERLPFATLKFSAVHQVIEELPPEVQVVVLVDGDADPYANWLRDLVTPIVLDEQIGAVTGNRWYFPRRGNLGAWCRFVFNGGALPYMQAGGHSWGGSLAMRRDFVDSAPFRDAFGPLRLPTEEQTVYKALRAVGKRLHFAPYAVMWNPESTSVAKGFQFTARQLFWGRLFFRFWTLIPGCAFAACLATLVAAAAGLARATDSTLGPWYLTVFGLGLAYWFVVVVSLAWFHRLFRQRIMPRQGRIMPAFTIPRLAAAAAAAPLALFVYAAAAWKAQFMQRVEWRGIRYDVVPPCSVRLTSYRPLVEADRRQAEEPLPVAIPHQA